MNDNDYEITADLYDHVTAYRDRQDDVTFYAGEAAAADGPVLEVGCGTGRVLLPCARAGARVTGLDRSAAMLSVARAKLDREEPEVRGRVRLVEGDMRSFDLGERFALVTMPFRGFQHLLTTDEHLACLECVVRHLRPGGRLVLDVFNPMLAALVDRSRMSEGGDEAFTTPAGARVVRRFRIVRADLPRQVQYMEMIYYVTEPDGTSRRLVEPFSLRHFFRYEVEHLLARCGFTDIRIDGDFAGTPWEDCGDPLEIVARARRF